MEGKVRRPKGYWNLATLTDSAKEFTKISDWSKADMGAYLASRRLGFFKTVTAHMISHAESISMGRTSWTKQACLTSSLKYKSRVEWEREDPSASLAARRHGWFTECTSHMPRMKKQNGYWTLQTCLAEAQKYPSISAWLKGNASSYQAANQNKTWFNQCVSHMTRLWEKKWDEVSIIFDAKRFTTLQEWTRESNGAYSAALKKGLVKAATAHMIKNPRWLGVATIHRVLKTFQLEYEEEKTFSDCRDKRKLPFDFYLPRFNLVIENHGTQHQRGWQGRGVEAIQRSDKIKKDYCERNQIAFLEIRDWEVSNETDVEKLIADKIKSIEPTLEISKIELTYLEIEATKVKLSYSLEQLKCIAIEFETRAKFKRGNESAYNFACRNQLIDVICDHMKSKNQAQSEALKKWTKEKVFASATKFQTVKEWSRLEGSAYNAARREGWLGDAKKHSGIKIDSRP